MRYLLVDFKGCIYWYYHAKSKDIPITFVKTIQAMAKQLKVDQTFILNEKYGSKFRKSRYPDYKANRQERKDKQTPQEKKEFEKFENVVQPAALRLFEMCGANVVTAEGYEADDSAAWFCANLPQDSQIILLSNDKDWHQLIEKGRVVQAKFTTDIVKTYQQIDKSTWLTNYESFVAEYGIEPDNWIDKKCLSGDNGDFVAGIPKIGETTALRLVQKYGNFKNVIEHAKAGTLEVPRLSQVSVDYIINNPDVLYINYSVMNLKHSEAEFVEVIGKDGLGYLASCKDKPTRTPNYETLKQLCYETGELDLYDDLENFCFWLK